MLKRIGLILLLLIAAVLIFAATKPDTIRVERSITIKAPPEKIFPLVNDLPSWALWSAYEKKDLAMKRTFSGPSSGKGAVYEWDGNNEVGKGRMEIIESTPSSKILIDLHFIEPFEGHNTAEFSFAPQGDVTTVTWAMSGLNNYFCKIISTFMNMDKMIGGDFEAGLAALKLAAEK